MVDVEHLSFTYQHANEPALRDVSLRIEPGECVLLCGASGCGKTTLARAINGLVPHYFEGEVDGSVHVAGLDTQAQSIETLSRKVGSVFQNPRSQFFCVGTTSEIAFGPENLGLPEDEVRSRVDATVAQFGIEDLLDRNIFGLSGGEKQKIACAGVSAMGPDVLVLDEPTSNLDLDAIDMLRGVLAHWKASGKTIVVAEHRLSWLSDVCDRVVLLESGSIRKQWSASGFFALTPNELNVLGLRSAQPKRDLLDSPTGFYPIRPEAEGPAGKNALSRYELSGFTYRYDDGPLALNLPALEIPEHAVVAVIGHNGAGKSTFSKCLAGLAKGFEGSVAHKGQTHKGKALSMMSYLVMQDVNHQLFANSVGEEALLGASEDDEVMRQRAAGVLERLGLDQVKDRHPMSLSGGQKQRCAIASAYLSDREIIILDEPTSGLDYQHMCQTADLIANIAKDKTVFIVTHDMELVGRCCTHVLHLEEGTIEGGAPMEDTEKTSVMKILNEYAGSRRHLITLGRILAAISAFVALVPFYELWKIIRVAISGQNLGDIEILAVYAVASTLLSLVIYVCALICTHVAAFRIQANMSRALLKRIVKLPLGVFDDEGTGKIRRIVNESTAATETFIAHNLPDKAVAAATPVGLVVLLAVFDWRLGVASAIPALVGLAFMMSMTGSKLQSKMAEYQNALETMSSEATEYVRGVPVVKTFGQTVHSFKRFKSAIDNFGTWATDYTLLLRGPMVGFMTSINAIFASLVAATYLLAQGGITPELVLNVMYYIIVTPLLTVTLTKIAYSGEQQMVVIDALERIDGILSIRELPDAADGMLPAGNSVEFDHASFRYPGAKRDAVHNLTLSIEPGDHVALVGPSGGGKTTAAQLVARFFDVTEGAVKVGGLDVRQISQQALMERVSFVFQDSRLLKATILDNIRLSKPDASEAEVREALHRAQCDDIIDKLPQGIRTVIGTKGTYLSGGERQRIAIARAILKDAPILVLDEATAFADPDNETKMQQAFEELARGKTLIMIAHRLSTVVNADCIYVLEDGSVRENGSHSELMSADGIYRRLFDQYKLAINWKVGA
ncbi:energy-coupling factor transporter ATPase [Curtanaerobium respiraculi]|uniref:energy-coupling factor transporter ATPase n=1 Tax=Curtanaerobium respiraculi TaxID=2949669 RepID=UPI0024B3AE41|nr:energy-coupling factor transporter ATPase [Curtanaerobium respiraculi]